MTLRVALLFVLASLMVGCVSSGSVNPMRTSEGRDEARDAYIQLGIGYLQQGEASRAKSPLRKALELDPNSADAHAALALVFQNEMENQLADEHYRKALSGQMTPVSLITTAASFSSRSAIPKRWSVSQRQPKIISILGAPMSFRTWA